MSFCTEFLYGFCTLQKQKRPMSPNPLIFNDILERETGFEPATSTLARSTVQKYILLILLKICCFFRIVSVPRKTHYTCKTKTTDHRNHNPHNYPASMGSEPLFRVIRYFKLSVTCALDITRRAAI